MELGGGIVLGSSVKNVWLLSVSMTRTYMFIVCKLRKLQAYKPVYNGKLNTNETQCVTHLLIPFMSRDPLSTMKKKHYSECSTSPLLSLTQQCSDCAHTLSHTLTHSNTHTLSHTLTHSNTHTTSTQELKLRRQESYGKREEDESKSTLSH